MKAKKTLRAIDESLEGLQEQHHRAHLGGSVIGRECPRQLFYIFRWYKKERFKGRMLRLFARGDMEETRFAEFLRGIGCQVWTHDESTGKQFRISDCNGHFGGSLDGVAVGIPDLPPGTPCLLEFKTHNANSYKKLVEDGICKSKPEHFAQCQVYMHKQGLPFALYLAVCKNDDKLHGELIKANPFDGKRMLDKASAIITAKTPPRKISQSRSFYKCGWCNFKDICHKPPGNVSQESPEKNCRTCQFSEPVENKEWHCGLRDCKLSFDAQKQGCEAWQEIPC